MPCPGCDHFFVGTNVMDKTNKQTKSLWIFRLDCFEYLAISTGLSWHVLVCLWKCDSGELKMKTMVYLMGHVKQVEIKYY